MWIKPSLFVELPAILSSAYLYNYVLCIVCHLCIFLCYSLILCASHFWRPFPFLFFWGNFFAYFCIPWPGSVKTVSWVPLAVLEGLELISIAAKILVYILANPKPNNLPTKINSKSNSLPPLQPSREHSNVGFKGFYLFMLILYCFRFFELL